MWSRTERFELPLFVRHIGEPGIEIFGAAAMRDPPDRSKIIAVRIMALVLHGASSRFHKIAIDAAYWKTKTAASKENPPLKSRA
jgi:hypothetical protein